MIGELSKNFFYNLNLFDVFFLIILIYNVIQCFLKRFHVKFDIIY